MSTSTPFYGDRVDEADVSYEPPERIYEGGMLSDTRPALYYRKRDGARVVWVIPSNGNLAGAFFALYVGDAAAYEPNMTDGQ